MSVRWIGITGGSSLLLQLLSYNANHLYWISGIGLPLGFVCFDRFVNIVFSSVSVDGGEHIPKVVSLERYSLARTVR